MSKPLIGITPAISDAEHPLTTQYVINRVYASSVTDAGGLPLLLIPTTDPDTLRRYADMCDGFLLSGGPDISPALYGEEVRPACGTLAPERDAFEFALIPYILASGKPILAICRGMQALNVYFGGTLYQDIVTECSLRALHRQPAPCEDSCHTVTPIPQTPLAALCGNATFAVNSYHHQAVKKLGDGLTPMAVSEDGLTEAFYLADHPFLIAVQWHPERLAAKDKNASVLFDAFVAASAKRT